MSTLTINDTDLATLVALWEQPEDLPGENLYYSIGSDHHPESYRTKLENIQQIADLMPHTPDSWIIITPSSDPNTTSAWYTQSAHHPDNTWETEVAYHIDGRDHNHGITHADGTHLSRAEAYAVMAEFCRKQALPTTFNKNLTLY